MGDCPWSLIVIIGTILLQLCSIYLFPLCFQIQFKVLVFKSMYVWGQHTLWIACFHMNLPDQSSPLQMSSFRHPQHLVATRERTFTPKLWNSFPRDISVSLCHCLPLIGKETLFCIPSLLLALLYRCKGKKKNGIELSLHVCKKKYTFWTVLNQIPKYFLF